MLEVPGEEMGAAGKNRGGENRHILRRQPPCLTRGRRYRLGNEFDGSDEFLKSLTLASIEISPRLLECVARGYELAAWSVPEFQEARVRAIRSREENVRVEKSAVSVRAQGLAWGIASGSSPKANTSSRALW